MLQFVAFGCNFCVACRINYSWIYFSSILSYDIISLLTPNLFVYIRLPRSQSFFWLLLFVTYTTISHGQMAGGLAQSDVSCIWLTDGRLLIHDAVSRFFRQEMLRLSMDEMFKYGVQVEELKYNLAILRFEIWSPTKCYSDNMCYGEYVLRWGQDSILMNRMGFFVSAPPSHDPHLENLTSFH